MSMSIDIDCYTKTDPGRILDLRQALGEGSAFHQAHGFFLDPVSPGLPTLPRVIARLPSTRFLDDEEAARVQRQVDEDTIWFQQIRHGRSIANPGRTPH